MKLCRPIGFTGLVFGLLPLVANAADLTGTVTNRHGQPVPGVEITLKDPAGKTLAKKTTDAKGHYAFSQVSPGKYQYVLDPLDTGLKGGSAASSVDSAGSTIDWRVSSNLLAVAAAAPGPNGPAMADAVAAGPVTGNGSNDGAAMPLFVHSGPIGNPVGGPPGVGSSSE
jgi:hypothetical protein